MVYPWVMPRDTTTTISKNIQTNVNFEQEVNDMYFPGTRAETTNEATHNCYIYTPSHMRRRAIPP